MRFDIDIESDDFEEMMMVFLRQLGDGLYQVGVQRRWGDRTVRYVGGAQGERQVEAATIAALNRLDRVLDVISGDRELVEKLGRVGLTGDELRAKLYFIQYWANRSLQGLWDAIRKTLENINIVLGSLSSVVPGIEPIREIKDVILHNMIDGEAD